MTLFKEEFLTINHLEKLQNFKCSDEPQVEDFLKEEVYSLMERNLVRTRLFLDENQDKKKIIYSKQKNANSS